ncbi:GD16176 [Drosophila simulans]|uniref:GD16176 n=1 Tax=Drosophila simulans TaxID=7240 RepID=B4R5P9_DROSI|nr:GD16176 [Drosophila simulans]
MAQQAIIWSWQQVRGTLDAAGDRYLPTEFRLTAIVRCPLCRSDQRILASGAELAVAPGALKTARLHHHSECKT